VTLDRAGGARRIKLWDLPVRIIHWSLVLLLVGLWWSWRSERTELHETLGYITLGLLLFRLYWGVFGSSTARFTHFIKGPREIALYLRGALRPNIGHNPLGALSVILLLSLMILEVGFGLFAEDVDAEAPGSLARFVSYETADWARAWHAMLFNIIVLLVAIHVLAILFYLVVKRDNLVGPMITGRKSFDEEVPRPVFAPLSRALIGVVLVAALTWWVSIGLRI